ncbi:hypothetical protein ROZALSC1DRAFT_24613 [Rozella allomycis CSF55]|uniref:Uncharacterized protein n=1 Tax=Rozella allomycis (strain CSF55) TaxID=988480 RepID=A0A4P9YCM5_ROZAC|nr:hypothetical protein ROZALSC1DRAFT_24613 [Rozella allomycis CSF55]
MNSVYVFLIGFTHLLSITPGILHVIGVIRLIYSVITDPKKSTKPIYPHLLFGGIAAVVTHFYFTYASFKTVVMTNFDSGLIVDLSRNFNIFTNLECYILSNISYSITCFQSMIALGYTSVLYLMSTQNIIPDTKIRVALKNFFLADGKKLWLNVILMMFVSLSVQLLIVTETINKIYDSNTPFYISHYHCVYDLYNYRFKYILMSLQVIFFSGTLYCCISLFKIVIQVRKRSLSASAKSALKPQLMFRCLVIVVVNVLVGIPWFVDHAIATFAPGYSTFSVFPALPLLLSSLGLYALGIFGSAIDVSPHVPFLSSYLNQFYIYIDAMAKKYSLDSMSKTADIQSAKSEKVLRDSPIVSDNKLVK